MGTKNQSSDPVAEPKKRRRVAISPVDPGVEPNDCIKICLVCSKDEVDASDSFCIQPIDLNQFFEEDGKIYGYDGLKIAIWVSSVSFHAYADINFQRASDGGKGITDLKSSLQNIFGENLIEKKDDFLQTFSTERDYVKSVVSKGEILKQYSENSHSSSANAISKAEPSDVEVVRISGAMPVGLLYSRLVPFVLLLIDGSNPIDITDPSWEILLIVQTTLDQQEDNQLKLLGFAAFYRFYHYPNSLRLRLGQILLLPPYQRKGYGHCLLEVLNNVAISEDVYDLTIEEPLDSLQHVRTCIDVHRLLVFHPIQHALSSVILRLKQENLSKKSQASHLGPPLSAVEEVRKSLKINKKQFLQCWEVLIYIGLDPIDKYMDNYRTIISDHVRVNVIGKDSGAAGKRVIDVPTEFDQEMSFVMFKSQNGEASNNLMDENQNSQEEQLRQLVEERIKVIKSIAEKVSQLHP